MANIISETDIVPEIEPDDPRAREGMKEFNRRVMAAFAGRSAVVDGRTVEIARGIMVDFRAWFRRQYGLRFPEMTLMVIPSVGELKFYRADLPDDEIRKTLLYLIDEYKKRGISVAPSELAAAIVRAWPAYRPDDAVDELKSKRIMT